jgi:hypothetical protein
MRQHLEQEVFWKTLIWRIGVSIPLSIIINYFYYNSMSIVLSLTIISNVVGYIAHYIFEIYWNKIWNIICSMLKKLEISYVSIINTRRRNE